MFVLMASKGESEAKPGAAMTGAELAAVMRENFDGQPWHGTALRHIIGGVVPERAHDSPLPAGRSIAELLAHTIAWIEIVESRLQGKNVIVTPEIDFPSAKNTSWNDLVARLDTAYERLVRTVEQLDDAALRATIVGKTYNADYMLRGLLHHNTYHGAQIALLKKF